MFPLYDSSDKDTFPLVNYAIIILNVFVFYVQLSSPNFERFIYQYGFIPQRFNPFFLESYGFIVTSMFMHGGFWHIISNLWFLHIFGDNVEDRMGHVGYAFFYILAGIVATFTQYIFMMGSSIPLVGASGAISGVAGAYFLLFRNSKVKSLVFAGYYVTTANLPVWLFLGYWFTIQLLSGFATFDPNAQSGVAWFAHIGGFIFGLFIALFLRKDRRSHDIIT
ncbi:MAG TPA: rhomboid family intramembrane serine protease [Candidatus Woesebacteria bacterium]|nr:rhomboid family intramembrane serine protease [Candidatus Woesebacteria bacterium]